MEVGPLEFLSDGVHILILRVLPHHPRPHALVTIAEEDRERTPVQRARDTRDRRMVSERRTSGVRCSDEHWDETR